jgi:3D (Asp-Asp-Asp) domain-containing protein
MLRSRIVPLGVLIVGLACAIILLLSPFSPIYAAPAPVAWSGNFVAYTVGDAVTYDGSNYKCIQSHTSEPNWDPADTADLWALQPNNGAPTPTSVIPTPTTPPIVLPTPTPTHVVSTPTPPVVLPTPTPTRIVPTPTPVVPTPTPTITPTGGYTTVSVTFYSDQGLMADGNETHLGACAAWIDQFPFGTMLKLYDPSNLKSAAYSCTVEDTGTHICKNNIDVSLPGQAQLAIQLGIKSMQLQVVGFDQVVAQQAANNHPSSHGCTLGAIH